MKRHPRLQGLSREHHHVLVLARRAMRGYLSPTDARRAFYDELALHFAVEEEQLLPALRASGAAGIELAERMQREHDAIRAAIAAEDVATFGRLLHEHVRFEERELFPAFEAQLGDAA
jgi:hemerythrin-like domain-containing protein